MIDLVYKTVLDIINKENQGYVTPTEFNTIAHLVQTEIFNDYFDQENRNINRENRGLINSQSSSITSNDEEKMSVFYTTTTLTGNLGTFNLPNDVYHIQDKGIVTESGRVIEEVKGSRSNYLIRSLAAPSRVYPIYNKQGKQIQVYPKELEKLIISYIKKPKRPVWTYIVIQGNEKFDPSNSSYQDFELHDSEFSNLVVRILGYFGLNLREQEVVTVAERLKQEQTQKQNN